MQTPDAQLILCHVDSTLTTTMVSYSVFYPGEITDSLSLPSSSIISPVFFLVSLLPSPSPFYLPPSCFLSSTNSLLISHAQQRTLEE